MTESRAGQHTFYDVLGVPRDATAEEIKRAYRRLARRHHPDVGGDEEVFKSVNVAYDTLGDPARRASYDLTLSASAGVGPPTGEQRRDPASGTTADARPADAPAADWQPWDPEPAAKPVQPEPAVPAGVPHGDGEMRVVVRPRFGTIYLAGAVLLVVWVGAFLAVRAWWPAPAPASLLTLCAAATAALPVVARNRYLRELFWPAPGLWLATSGLLALALLNADAIRRWPLVAAVAVLQLCPIVVVVAWPLVRRRRRIDKVVTRDSIEFDVFGVPGAGLLYAEERAAAREGAEALGRLAAIPAVKVLHSVVAPGYHDPDLLDDPPIAMHAVVRGRRVALVDTRVWHSGRYAWSPLGTLTFEGYHFPDGELTLPEVAERLLPLLPRRSEVRCFLMIFPAGHDGRRLSVDERGNPGVLAGPASTVIEQVASWLIDGEAVVDRRVLAAIGDHLLGE